MPIRIVAVRSAFFARSGKFFQRKRYKRPYTLCIPERKQKQREAAFPAARESGAAFYSTSPSAAKHAQKNFSFPCHTFQTSVLTIVEEIGGGHHIVRVMRFARRGRRQAQNPSFMCGGACRMLSALAFLLPVFPALICRRPP